MESVIKERTISTSPQVDWKKATWLIAGTLIFIAGILLEYVFDATIDDRIATAVFAVSYILLGYKVLFRMVKNIIKGRVFDENFLMGVATLGAIAIDRFPEAMAVMLFYQVGEFFQELAVAKSKKRIGDLMDIRPDYANILQDGQMMTVAPETMQVGDIFFVKPGEKIPLDGTVVEGEAMIDTSALTGESVPRKAVINDTVLSGCINQNGLLTIKATKTFGESTVSKILYLVENAAEKKAPTETFIKKFAKFYTPAVVISAVLLAIIPPLFFGGMWTDWIHRALIFLIISCPCALVLSIPMGFFGGIGAASKKGILVKGGNYIEALANLDIVVFDKTGTLTEGVFRVTKLHTANGFSENELMEWAAYAEAFSNHPIALSIRSAYGKEIDKSELSDYKEISGHGVSVRIKDRMILAGNNKQMEQAGIVYTAIESASTKVYVAVDGVFAGCILISDQIKEDSFELVNALKKLGVRKTVMLTGDSPQIAAAIATELQLDEVQSELLPQQKVEHVERLIRHKQGKKALAFVGDGINDAPVLAMADVGIAMGGIVLHTTNSCAASPDISSQSCVARQLNTNGYSPSSRLGLQQNPSVLPHRNLSYGAPGSDAAIEAADVVIMTDEPSRLIDAIKIARFTKRIVWQNIVMSLGVQFLFLFLATLGISSLWEAVFADVGVSLLAVFNAMRAMKQA